MPISVAAADKLIDKYNISQDDLVKHLDKIARVCGALVVTGNLEGSEARLNMVSEPAIITVSRNITNDARKRFCVAHELGHLELHRWKTTLCTSDDMMEWSVKSGSEKIEYEANDFGAALLMPERYFASLCDEAPSLDYFADIANQFWVSLTAASIRYAYFTSEPVAIVFSQNGYIRWFRASSEFEEMGLFVNVRSRVYSGSQAAKLFEGKTIPQTFRRTSADAWLRSGSFDGGASIQEQSWAMPNFNAVLTLLWIDEDFDDDDFL